MLADDLQKLLTEVVTLRIAFKSLALAVAARLNPEDPHGEYGRLASLLEGFYEDLRLPEAEALAKEWGLPLSPELQVQRGPGPEFDEWLKRNLGEG